MSWQSIEGHDDVVERFRSSLDRGRLASTFLFVGPPGIGKHTFAMKFAQALLCQASSEALLDPCGCCDGCVQVAARVHPDLQLIAKPADKSEIPVAAFIGEGEKRMREGLCHDIALKPFMGGRKVAIIDDADYLNEEGANALLKTLEEPPPRSVLILVGTSPEKQLPTIRSRAQLIRFRPLPAETLIKLIVEQGIAADRDEAQRIADHADGSLEKARELADVELWNFREQLLRGISRADFDSAAMSRQTVEFIEQAGKEARQKRVRARQLMGFVVEHYRQAMRAQPQSECATEKALAALDRTVDALAHIDQNANQSTLVECWLDDLSRIAS